MAAAWIDYLVADRFVVPREAARFYTEKLVYLPNSYLVNDSQREEAGIAPPRDSLGLPAAGFVFACFNNTYKLTPDFFDIWMRLLQQIPDSVLWLLQQGEEVGNNLRREAVARGASGDRLVFAPSLPYAEHINRLQCADLFLDTLPYNAHTTACDALWAGVPVLTCSGKAFPARVGGSVLKAVGLPELVTDSLAEYEAKALELASNGHAHAAVRTKLRLNRTTAPLFDTARFTRHLEAAYQVMWQRWRDGQAPTDIEISASVPRR
jgi:predicted O-linked N-acetylglucosamine transferase (SPINDLY family)